MDVNIFNPPFGGASGGATVVPSYTFATLPATHPVGQPVRVTNIGRAVIGASPVAATGSLWAFNGTVWEPVGGQVLLAKLDVPVTGLTNVEAVSGQIQLPAAFLKVSDRLRFRIGMTKSGTTDSGVPRFKVGTAGTTADTTVIGPTAMSATQLQAGFEYDMKLLSATAWRVTSRNDLGVGGASTAAAPVDITIANISNALYLNVGATSSSTNNTVSIIDAQIWLIR